MTFLLPWVYFNNGLLSDATESLNTGKAGCCLWISDDLAEHLALPKYSWRFECFQRKCGRSLALCVRKNVAEDFVELAHRPM